MELRGLLDLCQGIKSDEWVRIPDSGPAEFLLSGLVNLGSYDEPRWVALHHMYRAVYLADARLALAWGLDPEDWSDPRRSRDDDPPWMPGEWSSVRQRYIHVLLNDALVWQVTYGSVNWGAGVSGVAPWPRADYPGSAISDEPVEPTYWTTSWEVELARLLNDLQGNDDFAFSREMEALGWDTRHIHPID
ncbi:MAG TPA: hypothetical protein VHG69_01190, partial [Thermoleophilaceae bacterium]|nr:hypothetical protein [Thermoleophilaceae bacterium]